MALSELGDENVEVFEREDKCCDECFIPSHDVKRGHLDVAVPESCSDEDCECHSV